MGEEVMNQQPDYGDNLFIGRGESPPQHNVARYWCERAQRAEQALARRTADRQESLAVQKIHLYPAAAHPLAGWEPAIASLGAHIADILEPVMTPEIHVTHWTQEEVGQMLAGRPVTSGWAPNRIGSAAPPPTSPVDVGTIMVTPEMVAAGREVAAKVGADYYISTFVLQPVYRAMAALAPTSAKGTPDMWALYLAEKRRAAALEARITELAADLASAKPNPRDVPYSEYDKLISQVMALESKLAAFTHGPAPTRPDGTRAPEPKPWSPPKPGGDPRRIGN